jgi:hypothetical protein
MLRFCRTYIFTFDSLGGRHLQAISKLTKYLQLEAADKKNVENPSTADGKMALVSSYFFFHIYFFSEKSSSGAIAT